jgi:hypothetical protein
MGWKRILVAGNYENEIPNSEEKANIRTLYVD